MRIRVIWEGKTKDARLRALQAELSGRIAHFSDFAVEELAPARRKNGSRADEMSAGERRLLDKLKGASRVVLDERGREWTSREFADWLGRQAVGGTRPLAFLVGGRKGFSRPLRAQADLLLSLSRMTLTRDWARTLLLEQIYRGFTLLRGYPYGK